MPQPYTGGHTVGPESLMEYPAIAAKMANVAANWGLVEHELELLYSFFMSKWGLFRPGGGFLPTHPVARLTFTTLQTLNAKVDLLKALGAWVLTTDEQRELRDVLIPRVRQRAKERNRVAHGIWGTDHTVPDRVILIKTFGPSFVYSETDFDEMISRIQELRHEISVFQRSVSARVERHGWQVPEPDERQIEQNQAESQE